MTERDLRTVRDGGALRKLASGLEIVRRQKHEWRDALSKLSGKQLAQRTGKVWGSKFAAAWTIERLTDWIEEVVVEEGWTLEPGVHRTSIRVLPEPVGLADGKPVNTIRVVSDGRYVHAYPVEDE